jgi:hypothetical protein
VSDSDLTAAVAELREIAASLAETAGRLARMMGSAEYMAGLAAAARHAGYAEAQAENDAYQTTARAQQARAVFQVLPGGKTARHPRPDRRARGGR